MNRLKNAGICLALLLATGSSFAQNGTAMHGGMRVFGWMGGYGGYWVPILVLVIIVGLVAWVVGSVKYFAHFRFGGVPNHGCFQAEACSVSSSRCCLASGSMFR